MVEGHDGEEAAYLMAPRGKKEREKRRRKCNSILGWGEESVSFETYFLT